MSESDESFDTEQNNVPSDDDSDFEYLNEMPRKKRKIDSQPKKSTTKVRIQCKKCKKDYASLINHLRQKVSCREVYGDEYEEMRKPKPRVLTSTNSLSQRLLQYKQRGNKGTK